MEDNNKLKGLGGWLILIGLGCIFTPIKMLMDYIPLYMPIFEDGTWDALTTVGSDSYTPYFGALLIGEIIYNVIMFAISTLMIYLFFAKHYMFPKFYIGIVIASIIFVPLDSWVAYQVFPAEQIFDEETIKSMLKLFLVAAIWIPYMLISKRVKVTFVEKKPNSSFENNPRENTPIQAS